MPLNGSVLVSDVHLSDRPADEYRWKLFDQLKVIFSEPYLDTLWILGDLTEFKDYHSSRLVNRIVESLHQLRKDTKLNEVKIIKGNHDGLDPKRPYFLFLNCIPWIRFYHEPALIEWNKERIAVLPHTTDPVAEWADVDVERAHVVLMHATVQGARSETDVELDGIPADLFSDLRAKVFAGDIHVPQRIGRVEYVGAPYPVKFGDSFQPRAITYPLGKRKDVPLDTIHKVKASITTATELRTLDLKPGDMLKVELTLRESELGQWHDEKKKMLRWCEKRGVTLSGVELKRRTLKRFNIDSRVKAESPKQTLVRYCQQQKIAEPLTDLGVDLIEE